jgi:hypothetical protein
MLIELQAALNYLASFSRAMDQDEKLQYFSWSVYLIIGLVYSVILFFYVVSEDNLVIFSKLNKRSLTQILTIHTAFVTLLLCALRICSYTIQYLPFWITREFDLGEGNMSIADFIFFILALALLAFERQWLVIATDGSESAQE